MLILSFFWVGGFIFTKGENKEYVTAFPLGTIMMTKKYLFWTTKCYTERKNRADDNNTDEWYRRNCVRE